MVVMLLLVDQRSRRTVEADRMENSDGETVANLNILLGSRSHNLDSTNALMKLKNRDFQL